MSLSEKIKALYAKAPPFNDEDYQLFTEFRQELERGSVRAAEISEGSWKTNIWVKMGILAGFRLGMIKEMQWSKDKKFWDKNTLPERIIAETDGIRLVPGGSSVRTGAYISSGVTIMPPSYVNIGAYIDEGTMLDSHSLVGSCAQIGKNVHLSAAAIIGGVLEPIGNNPVIIEDGAFIGGNCGVYEGVIVKTRSVIAAGVVLTASTKVYDAVNREFITSGKDTPLVIPERAVLVSGSRMLKEHEGIALYCPVIIKYRDEKTDDAVTLEDWLR